MPRRSRSEDESEVDDQTDDESAAEPEVELADDETDSEVETAASEPAASDVASAAESATPAVPDSAAAPPSHVVYSAELVEAATADLLDAIAEADRLLRSHSDYDGSAYGGVIGSYVLGQVGGVLGVTQRPRRDVPSLVAAVADLG